ncbi:hypothetical protein JCM8097_008826 [Rhodosporidiobolus ruineniae]
MVTPPSQGGPAADGGASSTPLEQHQPSTVSQAQPAPAARLNPTPPLTHQLSTLDVHDSTNSAYSLPPTSDSAPPSSKRRRSSAGIVASTSATSSIPLTGHRRTPSGKILADGNNPGSPLLGSSLSGFSDGVQAPRRPSHPSAGMVGLENGGANGSSGGEDKGKAKEKAAEQRQSRLSPIDTSAANATSSLRTSPPPTIELPSFPVLPPSQPSPNQTFQTPFQVSSILSLPPPLLMQLARTDSPQEQRAIAERADARSYLSSMAIPPPSPTTLVNDIQRAGLAMTPNGSSSARLVAPASAALPSSADASTSSSNPASTSALSLLPSLTASSSSSDALAQISSLSSFKPLHIPSNGHPAIPLLLGQVFSPPMPGVLAPIPGIPGVGEAVQLAIGDGHGTEEAGAVGANGEFRPKYASVEDWSYIAAKERVGSGSGGSGTGAGAAAAAGFTMPSAPSTPVTATPTTPSRPLPLSRHSFNASEVAALAAQMKQWALAEQEKQVEQHVVEAKSAAVILAAQAAAATASGEEAAGAAAAAAAGGKGKEPSPVPGQGAAPDGLDLSEYAEAYKKQLVALASGYFAQLHRDALERLVEEKNAEEGAPTAGALPASTSTSTTQPSSTTSPPPTSSASPFTSLPAVSTSTSHPSSSHAPPSPIAVLSSSQAPTLTSLTSLTSSRTQAEAMHVRASAAAAVAAQVMAAKDLAQSAGERLVRLGADPRKVVEEVREVVSLEAGAAGGPGSRRGSATVPREQVAVGMTRAASGVVSHEGESASEQGVDKMAIEDVGVVPVSTTSVGVPPPAPEPAPSASFAQPPPSSAAAGAPPAVPSASLQPGAGSAALSGNANATAADLATLPAAQAPAASSSRAGAAAPPPPSAVPAPPPASTTHAAAAAFSPAAALTNPSVLASVAAPQKRDFLLSYAHQLYAKDPGSDELLPLLHTIESMHPDHLPTLLLISCVYYTRGELESSLYYNKRLLEFDPSYVEAMSNIGTTLRAMGKWSEAEQWWWKAIKLRPTYWDATENLLGVLCNPSPHITRPGAAEPPPPPHARYQDALALCDYVESQVFAVPASAQHPAVPSSTHAFLNPLQSLPRPRPLPPTVPYNHVHRLQNLFYAKGNLRLALGDTLGAQDEYEKAIEVGLALPEWAHQIPGIQYPIEGCTTRDLVVAATVIGKVLAAYAESGGNAEVIARTAQQLGIADERGGVPWERVLRVVKNGGNEYVAKLLAMGGGVLPTVLLEPPILAQFPAMLFPECRGRLPSLLDPAAVSPDPSTAAVVDPARKQIENSAKQTTSTMLLTLAKILQDSLAPTSAVRYAIGGIPASQSLLLPLYYVALALYPSPSTCNNLGILLSTLTATTTIANPDPTKPPVVLTGQRLALSYYQMGLKLDPRHPHLYTNLGSLLKDMGKLAEAVEMYKQAVAFNPTFDVALANLANAVKDTGQIQESIPYYREAVKLNPNFPEAVCGLVNALGGVCDWQGRGGVGEEWLVDGNKQLEYIPAVPGKPLPRKGYMAQISDLVAKQLRDGHSYGVGALRSCGGLNDWLNLIAMAIYGTTVQHAPSEPMQIWASRLSFLLSDFDRARSTVNEGGYLIRLVERLMRRIQRRWYIAEFGKTTYADGQQPNRIVPTQQDVVNYRRPPLPPSLPPIPVPTVLPFHCFTLPVTARETRLISHRTGLRISHSTLNQPWMPPIVYPPPRPPINGKLNIGYVSSDLGNHPLSHLMQSVFGYHDLDKFNVFVYATSPSDNSPYRQKIESESQHFFDVAHESTQQIVERIVRDEIHVLVNLSGYTKGARNEVFAARPAPVQMSYMGFASTLSAGWCDYFIVDPIVCPPHLVSGNQWRYWNGFTGTETDPSKAPAPTDFEGDLDPESDSELFVYTEKLIYLPHSYFVTDHKQAWREDETIGLKPGEPLVTSTLPPSEEVTWALEEDKRLQMRRAMFPNIRDDTVIFANWNQLYKIDPFIFRIWLNILKAHPNSILWLLRFPAPGERHLKDTAAKWAGEDVANRVIFTDVANKNEHIHRGRIADLFLDTTECNAHTTAADILWSGTPILTYPRHAHKMCSRVAASIAVATGLGSQMIVPTAEAYEKRALELANGLTYEKIPADPSKPASTLEGREQRRAKGELSDLRKELFLNREQSPLFDTKRWVRNLEKGLVEAWERWVGGQEFEDDPSWGHGPEKNTASIWISDDEDGSNIAPRRDHF